jgi:hypothetical protein
MGLCAIAVEVDVLLATGVRAVQAMRALWRSYMDVSVLGGVTPQHVRAQVEIWDRLVQELHHYLRSSADKLAAASASGQSAGADQPEAAAFAKKGPAAAPTLN